MEPTNMPHFIRVNRTNVLVSKALVSFNFPLYLLRKITRHCSLVASPVRNVDWVAPYGNKELVLMF